MRTLNLGILAHVDAGKTSLTERLLHAVGVTDEIGSVDAGNTRTDSLELERRRGITIKSAVVSFVIDDNLTVNLIDTPGHPDFIAEVERVLGVLDGAVLVVSAVEGVQAQTHVLMRTLRRLRIPALIFVNKVDRSGADCGRVLRSIAADLMPPDQAPAVLAMGSVDGAGTRSARCIPSTAADSGFRSALVDLLSERDDELLAAWLDDGNALPHERLHAELAAQTARALVHPVYFGSAITGVGTDALIAGVRDLLPARVRDVDGPLSGTVFKVDRGPAGEKIAYLRVLSGTVRVRDRLGGAKITAISVFENGEEVRRSSVEAGRIGRLWGLDGVRIGDTVGPESSDGNANGLSPAIPTGRQFAPPTLETAVLPATIGDRGALHLALTQLAEQDPLINLRRDDQRQEVYVSLYGEVQKEVIQATLADGYGIVVDFRETTTICIERVVGTGTAQETLGKPPNPFLAGVGLRVDPAPLGTGVEFRLEVELGSMPYAFFAAVEETVRETLGQGLNGWQIDDCTVTMTYCGYYARQSHAHGGFDKSMSSTAGDFRNLTPLVLMEALRGAGTEVLEPMHRFRLELPTDALGPVLPALARLRAIPEPPTADGAKAVVEGVVPAARVHELTQRLPALTRGEGGLESAFDHHRAVVGPVPSRRRTDHNPLDREEYLLRVVRRVATGQAEVGG